jgi:dihydroneopterin aldolase
VSYKISICGLEFETIIGILDFERVTPQLVSIDFECSYEKKDDFVNYVELRDLIKSSIINNEYLLIEDALDDILSKIKSKYDIFNIRLKIAKLDILDDCTVAVEKSIN